MVLSPFFGFAIGLVLMVILSWVFFRVPRALALRLFSRMQLVSASFMAFSHGANDAQKAMGIITLALVSAGVLPTAEVPTWVIGSCALAMGLGTAVGGWRIVRTLGMRIVKLEPVHGFAAETGAAIVLLATAHIGLPVSTTHTITSTVMGVGAVKRLSAGALGRDQTNPVGMALHLAGGCATVDYLLPVSVETAVDDSCATGRWTTNRLPLGVLPSTQTCPLWASTICLTMARPSPVPPSSRERALSTR
jgi:phosphate/sulfate permease